MDFRRIILAELKKRGMTINALARAMAEKGIASREMIHKYLSGRHDLTGAKLGQVLTWLKIKVK